MSSIKNSRLVITITIIMSLLLLSQSALSGIRRDRHRTWREKESFRPEWSFQLLLDNQLEEGEGEGFTLALQSRPSQFNAWRLSLSGFETALEMSRSAAARCDAADIHHAGQPRAGRRPGKGLRGSPLSNRIVVTHADFMDEIDCRRAAVERAIERFRLAEVETDPTLLRSIVHRRPRVT